MSRGIAGVAAIAFALSTGLIAPAVAQPAPVLDRGALSTDAERAQRRAGLELLTYVPAAYDKRCLIQTDDDIATDPLIGRYAGVLQAFLICGTDDDAITLHMFKLADEDAVNSLYDAYTPNGLDPNAPGCETDGTWGEGRGRLKCYLGDGGGSVLIWTLPSGNAIFTAIRSDNDVAALNAWWESSSPPIDDPPAPDELVSDGQWRRNARILRKSVPEGFRGSCTVPAISADELGGLHRDRLALRTVLFCSPGNGIDTYYVAGFRSREASQAFLDNFDALVDEEAPRVQAGGVTCEGQGTWSRGASRAPTGERLCYFADDGGVFMVWTDRRQGIALAAGRSDGNAAKLIQFYKREAGPLPNPSAS